MVGPFFPCVTLFSVDLLCSVLLKFVIFYPRKVINNLFNIFYYCFFWFILGCLCVHISYDIMNIIYITLWYQIVFYAVELFVWLLFSNSFSIDILCVHLPPNKAKNTDTVVSHVRVKLIVPTSMILWRYIGQSHSQKSF